MEENKSVVSSYRVSQDTKDKIKEQLKNLGLTQEDYFSKVVTLMEIENVKKNKLFAVDSTEIQDLTQRIYNIFINMCDQGNSFLSNKDIELEELKNNYKDMLLNKENSITQLKDELQGVYSDLSVIQKENEESKNNLLSIRIDYDKQLEQMESSLRDKELLIAEYKQKNDDLMGIVSEYKQYKEDVEKYKQLLSEVQTENISLSDDIKNKDSIINSLNKSIEKDKNEHISIVDKLKKDHINIEEGLKKEHISTVEKLNTEHAQELQTATDKLSIEKEKEILKLQQEHQVAVSELNSKYNNKINEYQNKYEELLKELEKERTKEKNKKVKKENSTEK